MKKILFLLIFVLFSITNITAQVYKIYNTTNGLNGNLVKSLTVDNSGNLWIGTSTGLNKFDGTTFTCYSTLNGLPHNNTKSLTTDASGTVWIGTQNGLSKTNGLGFVNYNTTNGLPSNNITALASGSGGILWVGTFSSGLSKYNGTSFTNYTTVNGLITNGISSICEDLTGNVWLGTALGISVFDGTTFTNYNTGNGLPSNSIKALYCDASGNVWIGTNLGLVKYNGTSFSTLTTANGLLSNFITSINEDDLGNLLIGYYDVGISKYNGTNFTNFNLDNGFIWSNIIAIKSFNNNINAGNTSGLIEFKKYLIPPDRFDYLDTNNISAGINASGYLFATPNQQPAFNVPKNTNISTFWGSSIWMGGIDQNNLLHLLGRATNAQDNDTWPGSILSNLNTFIDDSIWNRVWKISKAEIDSHILNFTQSGYLIPKSISEWPAPTADYVDLNNNNMYDPQNGDYPFIRGDQAILSIFNDLAGPHGSGGLPLGIEVHSLTYSFNSTDSAIANTVFNNYKIYNYSSNNYNDFYIGIQSNLSIGEYVNDYIGCDSILSLYYGYNATVSDYFYGTHIPAQGVVFLSSPLSSFNYFNDIAGVGGGIGPETSMEYYNILNGYWMDGTPYTFGGNGHGGSVYTKYCYSSDPNNPAGWSEVTVNNSPGIRTGIGKVGPFTLLAGKAICLDVAFPNAIDYFGTNLSSVSLLKERTSQIINFYNTQGWECGEIYTDTNTVAHLYTQNPTICKGQAYQLNNIVVGGAPPYTYNWSSSIGLSNDTILNPTVTLNQNAQYILTVTDHQNNVSIDTIFITVSSPYISAGSDVTVCRNETATLTATPGFTVYNWNCCGTGQSITVNTGFSYSGLMNFIVFVYDSLGCSNKDTVSVTFLPIPDINIANSVLCNTETLLLDAGLGADHYLWNTGATTSSVLLDGTILSLGVHSYNVHAWNDNGCNSYDTVQVNVQICSAVDDMEKNGFKIYPNPSDGLFYIESTQIYSLIITDIKGDVIFKKQDLSGKEKIDLKDISKGIYFLELQTNNKILKTKLVLF